MIYEFECKKCGEVYEEFVKAIDPTGKYKNVKCPKCSSTRKIKLISAVKHNFVNPEGTGKMNTHEYRAKHAIEKPGGAKDQRKYAEEHSHMGSSPYPRIDDIGSGKYFGEVK